MAWAGISSAIGGALGGLASVGFPPWATMAPETESADVWNAASAYSKTYQAIAKLKTPMHEGDETAYWAYFNGSTWAVARDRLNFDAGASDVDITAQDIVEPSIWPMTGSGGTSIVPAGGGKAGEPGFGNEMYRVKPRTISQRRCPPKMRLGTDGWCYYTRMLPRAFRANQTKKAPVSWSDAQSIRKGRAAERRIQAFAKRSQKEARKLAPRRRRTS